MPRAIDLSREPPPEATCFSCGRRVALDKRARARRKFRCPLCRADNRVEADGLGRPLRALAERVEEMPLTRCAECGDPNRLPFELLRRGRFVCHHCGRLQTVPRTLRRRAGIAAWWQVASLLLVIVAAIALAWLRTANAVAMAQLPGLGSPPVTAEESADNLVIQGARRLGNGPEGQHYEVGGRILNPFPRTATFHLCAELYDGDKKIAWRTISVRDVPPGAWREFRIEVIDRRRGWVNAASIAVVGVS